MLQNEVVQNLVYKRSINFACRINDGLLSLQFQLIRNEKRVHTSCMHSKKEVSIENLI